MHSLIIDHISVEAQTRLTTPKEIMTKRRCANIGNVANKATTATTVTLNNHVIGFPINLESAT